MTSPENTYDCFVIMPFVATVHRKDGKEVPISADEWNHIFINWITPAVESYPDRKFKCRRSAAKPGNFVKGIIQDLHKSPLVIADLTGQRPNVYYELGVRHALQIGTVMITQDLNTVPSDLNSYYCFEYQYSTEAYKQLELFPKFERALHEKIAHLDSNDHTPDSPVSDFLDLHSYFDSQKAIKSIRDYIAVLEGIRDLLIRYVGELKRWSIQAKKSEFKSMPEMFLDIGLFNALTARFFSCDTEYVPSEIHNQVLINIENARFDFIRVWNHYGKIFLPQLGMTIQNFDDYLKIFIEKEPLNILNLYKLLDQLRAHIDGQKGMTRLMQLSSD